MRAEAQRKFYEVINRSFGNFKLIKLQVQDQSLLKDFSEASYDYTKANVTNATLAQVPRLFLEAIGFGIIISIVIYLVWKYHGDVSGVLAIISMFVLSLYRLMPSVNRIMTAYNQILFNHKSLDIIHHDLSYGTEKIGDKELMFQEKINLENISFEYESNKPILKNINLEIKKGSSVAFIGESGSGKSTLVDVIIGLYKPKNGKLYSDNAMIVDSNVKSWRLKVGYIPQSVYLFDGTVGENISFGLKYDKRKIDAVLKKAKIYDFLETKDGQNTTVGEDGIMLSGGQKQRIAIARALYLDPEILVLDEATSALDDDTEKEIMQEMYEISGDKTLIIIAHRLSTIDRCDTVYELKNGDIFKTKIE